MGAEAFKESEVRQKIIEAIRKDLLGPSSEKEVLFPVDGGVRYRFHSHPVPPQKAAAEKTNQRKAHFQVFLALTV